MSGRDTAAIRPPERRVTTGDLATMVQLYTTKYLSIRAIAATTGFCYATVHQHLRAALHDLRPRGGMRIIAPDTTARTPS